MAAYVPREGVVLAQIEVDQGKRDQTGLLEAIEPVISCATDRRLRPLGYARHAAGHAA